VKHGFARIEIGPQVMTRDLLTKLASCGFDRQNMLASERMLVLKPESNSCVTDAEPRCHRRGRTDYFDGTSQSENWKGAFVHRHALKANFHCESIENFQRAMKLYFLSSAA
jgi:hypothetical protein